MIATIITIKLLIQLYTQPKPVVALEDQNPYPCEQY